MARLTNTLNEFTRSQLENKTNQNIRRMRREVVLKSLLKLPQGSGSKQQGLSLLNRKIKLDIWSKFNFSVTSYY